MHQKRVTFHIHISLQSLLLAHFSLLHCLTPSSPQCRCGKNTQSFYSYMHQKNPRQWKVHRHPVFPSDFYILLNHKENTHTGNNPIDDISRNVTRTRSIPSSCPCLKKGSKSYLDDGTGHLLPFLLLFIFLPDNPPDCLFLHSGELVGFRRRRCLLRIFPFSSSLIVQQGTMTTLSRLAADYHLLGLFPIGHILGDLLGIHGRRRRRRR